jgi:hypothetical protein
MSTPRSHVRVIVELETHVAQELQRIIDARLQPLTDQFANREYEYQRALTAWQAKSVKLVKTSNGARATPELVNRLRKLFAEHSARRPKRPMGRPPNKVKHVDQMRARNEFITELIQTYVVMQPKPKPKPKPKTFSKKTRGKNITTNTPVAQPLSA